MNADAKEFIDGLEEDGAREITTTTETTTVVVKVTRVSWIEEARKCDRLYVDGVDVNGHPVEEEDNSNDQIELVWPVAKAEALEQMFLDLRLTTV